MFNNSFVLKYYPSIYVEYSFHVISFYALKTVYNGVMEKGVYWLFGTA